MHPTEEHLNEYVEASLDAPARADVERHLETCAVCRRQVEDLRAIHVTASALPVLDPPARAWQRIEAGIRQSAPRRERVVALSTLGWLAAAAALVLATFVGVRSWRASAPPPAPAAATTAADTRQIADSVATELRAAEEHYQKAISGLEQITDAEKGALDPQTAATLQKNLAVIDQAISESRAALKVQPNSVPAQQSLLDSFKTKMALLQDTVALIIEMRRGNDAGAAKAVSELKQKS